MWPQSNCSWTVLGFDRGFKYNLVLITISMVKFDGIRMQELIEVQDPDKDGGITLVFQDNRYLRIRVKDGKLETISEPE